MQADVIEAGPFERMITLRLDEPELEDAKNRASRKLSRDLAIKGFRPGKAPRAVVERMVGADRLRSEAIEDALPEMVSKAIEEAGLEPVTTPRIEAIRDAEGGAVEVEVRVTLWPSADVLPDYSAPKSRSSSPPLKTVSSRSTSSAFATSSQNGAGREAGRRWRLHADQHLRSRRR